MVAQRDLCFVIRLFSLSLAQGAKFLCLGSNLNSGQNQEAGVNIGRRSKRTRLAYKPGNGRPFITNEATYVSVEDPTAGEYKHRQCLCPPVPLLRKRDSDTWILRNSNEILKAAASLLKIYMKNRIRTVHS
jgi:hypothetical protein